MRPLVSSYPLSHLTSAVTSAVTAAAAAHRVGDLEAIEDYCAIGKGGLQDEEQRGALHYAVAYDHPDAVQALLAAGAALEVTDQGGNTPLHYAAGCALGRCGAGCRSVVCRSCVDEWGGTRGSHRSSDALGQLAELVSS